MGLSGICLAAAFEYGGDISEAGARFLAQWRGQASLNGSMRSDAKGGTTVPQLDAGPPPAYSLTTTAFAPIVSSSVAVGDVNADGRDDIVATSYDMGTGRTFVNIFLQSDEGALYFSARYETPGEQIDRFTQGVALGDLNEDGRADVIVTPALTGGIYYLLSEPGGGFGWREDRWVAQRSSVAVVVADMDGDGHLDVVGHAGLDGYQYAQPNLGSLITYFGNGSGYFDRHTSVPAGESSLEGLAIGDLNSDGLPDLASASWYFLDGYDFRPRVRLHDGKSGFREPVTADARRNEQYGSLALGDVTGDGRKDFALATFGIYPTRLVIYPQLADGTLATTPILRKAGGMMNAVSLTSADLNGDGRGDIVQLVSAGAQLYYHLQDDYGLLPGALVNLFADTGDCPNVDGALATGDFNGDGVTDVVAALGGCGLVIASGKLTPFAGSGGLPGPPTIGTASVEPNPDNQTADVRRFLVPFAAPLDNGGNQLSGYTVTSIPGGGVDLDSGSLLTTHQMTGLDDNTTYRFYARARNAAGLGPASALSNPVTIGVPPVPGAPLVLGVHGTGSFEGVTGQSFATFTARMSGYAPTGGVSFDVATHDGTANAGSDYVALGQAGLVIPEGKDRVDFVVAINGDAVVESDETYQVEVSNPHGAVLGASTLTAKIYNDDVDQPRIYVEGGSASEGDAGTKVVNVMVRLTEPAPVDVTFDIQTNDASAGGGSDYVHRELLGQKILAGQTSYSFPVELIGDTNFEIYEEFKIRLANIQQVGVAEGYIGWVAIINDDPEPTLSIASAIAAEGSRGNWVLNLEATLTATLPYDATFSARMIDGNATAGTDYISRALAGITIPRGATSASVRIEIVGDTWVEGDERFYVVIGDPYHVAIKNGFATVVLRNDDIGGAISVQNSSRLEGDSDGFMTFLVRMSEPLDHAVTFDLFTSDATATSGSDYAQTRSESQVMPAGGTTTTFTVPIKGDSAAEMNEQFLVNIENVVGATISDGQAIGTLVNDDLPTISIADVSISEGNAGTSKASFLVTLSTPVPTPVSFHFATTAASAVDLSDYWPNLGGATFPAGSTSMTIDVDVIGDTLNEDDETFTMGVFVFDGALPGKTVAVGTILNDDAPSLRTKSGPARNVLDRRENVLR